MISEAGLLGLMAAILVLCAVVPAVRSLARTYLTFRGTRLVTCPETADTAAVEVDAGRAVISTAFGRTHLRLRECSRWPANQDCGQECLRRVAAAPEDCLVRTIVNRWYRGKPCVYCGRKFGEIHWSDHTPALWHPVERATVEWREIRPERLPEVLATHFPVCWNCHIAATFRRLHPDLVVERPRYGDHRHPPPPAA